MKTILLSFLISVLAFSASAQTISGKVYFDSNNNGATDGSDVELPAMSVQLFIDANGNDIPEANELDRTVITSATGAYSFTSVSGKAIVTIKPSSLGEAAKVRSTIQVANGASNTNADVYVIGQYPVCYAFADSGDDMVSFNRFDGETVTINSSVSSSIEAATTNYNATLLYAMDGDNLEKYNYTTGARISRSSGIGTISYTNNSGGRSTTDIDDVDGIAIAGPDRLWLGEVSAGGILFQTDTNGNVIRDVFGSGRDGKEIVLPSAISSCGQLDDLALNPLDGKLYAVYSGCSGSTSYLVLIPTSGSNAGEVQTYWPIREGSTDWDDVEGLTLSLYGQIMAVTGANASPSSQNQHYLTFEEFNGEVVNSVAIKGSSGDYESCDCIARNSNPFVVLSISGTVYEDIDGLSDGTVDGTPISSVGGNTLYAYLTDAAGIVVQKATLSNGSYTFNGVLTNFAYEVVISTTNVGIGVEAPSTANLPQTFKSAGEAFGSNNQAGTGNESGTPDLSIAVVTSSTNVTGVDFGLREENTITGTVWRDSNRDETINAGETERAQNVKVYLFSDTNNDGSIDANSSPIDSVLTAADGTYSFGVGYTSGTESYVVLIDSTSLPTGNTLTTTGTQTASFNSSGQTDSDNDFGYNLDPAIVSITGTVWKDENEDGDIDAGENERAENIRLRIYEDANTNGSIDGDEPFIYVDATTDANGYYEVNLPYTSAVTYLVEVAEHQLEGDLTTNSILSASFSSGGTVVADRDFGYNPNSGKKYISGTVFNDNNQDTLLNAGDLGDEGVDVYLYVDANGNGVLDANENIPVATTTTDRNGFYEFEQNNSCQTSTISRRISNDNDDVNEDISSGYMYHGYNALYLSWYGSEHVGTRFRNITIPANATIEEAYIQFTAYDDGDANSNLTIRGIKEPNTGQFTSSSSNLSSRPRTSSSVSWSVSRFAWDNEDATLDERTPELKSLVQEIVNQSTWSSGNAMGFILSPNNNGNVEAYSHDGSPSKAPLLYIEYEANCNDNFIIKIDENDLPSGYVYSTDDIETAVNLTGGGVYDIGNDFGYKFNGSLSGHVFNDADGLEDNVVDGNGVSTASNNQLYVSLLDINSNTVLQSKPVSQNGSYMFLNLAPNTNYKVVLSTQEGAVGTSAPTLELPSLWVTTGENLGATAGSDGSADLMISAQVQTGLTDNVNFGINMLPTSDDFSHEINSPAMNAVYHLISAHSLSPLSGEDFEDGVYGEGMDFTISSLDDMNGNVLFYDANGNGAKDVNEALSEGDIIRNYDLDKLSVSFEGMNSTSFAFTYATIDAANDSDPTPNEYEVSWTTPLPVDLTSFTAKALDATTNILDWTTASELNNDKFIIERRLETEMEFSPVGEVYGAGTTQEMQVYQFTDYNVPQTGSVVYYRLKQIDFDGQFEYSGIVAVTQTKALQTVVYPNPTQHHATVTIVGESATNSTLNVTDLFGSDLTGSVGITNLGGSYQLDVNGLRNGTYIITVIQGNRKHTSRLTVSK
jgi:hypothetical protein